MNCAWKELLEILPLWLRGQIAQYEKSPPDEIRLRTNSPPELIIGRNPVWLNGRTTQSDLLFCINTASRYSPWAAATMAQGYLTAPGGHRIGICGETTVKEGSITGIRSPTSVCIRVAKDLPEIADAIPQFSGSVLILGAPGWGKTTLLRAVARKIAEKHLVSVVDEREELFPSGFPPGKRMDVLSGCSKSRGVEMVLRTMCPEYIAMDEITAAEDCQALLHVAGCGVKLLATAHASGAEDFRRRRAYAPLSSAGVFDHFLILNRNRTCYMEGAF